MVRLDLHSEGAYLAPGRSGYLTVGRRRDADEEYVFQILPAGASGYVVKKAAPTELVSAIPAVYRGDSFLSPAISRTGIKEYVRQAKGWQREATKQLTQYASRRGLISRDS